MPNVLEYLTVLSADDTSAVAHLQQMSGIQPLINEIMMLSKTRFAENDLRLNISQTEVMVIQYFTSSLPISEDSVVKKVKKEVFTILKEVNSSEVALKKRKSNQFETTNVIIVNINVPDDVMLKIMSIIFILE
ncbi:hypothetical protein HHI36_011657 [Cryptolaemus montrouzieri]|uniref:Uncharacterized protein n=1 Tax=Cryptolaemus montrouzieri TaxID=559131 RepID=A0ABD2MMD1_9CUCU